MKKIVIITNGTLPVPATLGGAVENLLQTFMGFNEKSKDFELIVFSVSNDKAFTLSKSYKGSRFIFIESKGIKYKTGQIFRYLLNRFRVTKVKNQFIYSVLKYKKTLAEADLILIENNPTFIPFVKKETSKPIGLHLHNDYLNIDKKKFSKVVLKNTNFVIGVSRFIKNRVKEVAPPGCKVDFVYNGINLDRFNKKQNKEKSNDIVILFTGRLQKTKGIKLLIEVFLEILESYDNIKLLIVGGSSFGDGKKNSFIQELESLSKKASGKISFTGYIDYNEIHEVYSLADIAVFPSLTTEAFPLTTIEALASGLPVVVSDAGGMPEGVNNKCGFVIERGENMKKDLKRQLIKLIMDKDLRTSMSIEAKSRSLKFSDIEYSKSFASILNEVKY